MVIRQQQLILQVLLSIGTTTLQTKIYGVITDATTDAINLGITGNKEALTIGGIGTTNVNGTLNINSTAGFSNYSNNWN